MTSFIKYLSRQSRIFYFTLGLVLIVVIALSDYVTGFDFDLSAVYLVPICIVGWMLGRTIGIVFSVLAVAAWFANDRITGHIFPHAFLLYPYSLLHLWKALVLLATWIIFVIVLDKLKVALARADERFATVLEGLYEAVYVVDPDSGELLYLNDRCRNTFGAGEPLTRSRQIEAQLQPLPPSHDEEHGGEVYDAAHQRWYLFHTRPLRWVDGRDVRLVAVTDITDRKQAEELNRQQQEKLQLTSRLITVGHMTSTLAHEINAEQNNVQLTLDLAPGLPVVDADEIMLEQVILNITRNGIESMQQTPPGERELTIRARSNQCGAIEIEIADSGCGIPEAMIENWFESFFTTKPDGLGMGLSICRSILELHNGRLWATRNPGRGSTFHVTLPVAQT